MQTLGSILKGLIKDTGVESAARLNAIRRQWDTIVGQPVAMHTFPDMIKGRLLIIIVDTPQWMHHLGFFKEEISRKLKSYNVSSIRFRLGRLPEKAVKQPAVPNVELTDDDLQYIENTIRNIKDEGLKEKFRTLITHALTRGKLRRKE